MTATTPDQGKQGSAKKTERVKTPMSPEHKAALAEGRRYGKIVSDYLEALEEHKPRRGRQVTPETLQERLNKVIQKIVEAKPTERLALIQQRMDLEAQIRRSNEDFDIETLEKEFVKVAKPYAERKGYTYQAFREFGVPANVLKEAGLDRKVA